MRDDLMTTLSPGDVFTNLAATDLATRDNATRIAINMGPSVALRLLKLIDESPTARRRALWTFTGIHLRRAESAVQRPQRVHFRHEGTLASALSSLGALFGIPVGDPVAAPDVAVAVDLPNTTLLAALDDVVEQAGCRAVQGVRGELATALGKEPPYPTAYTGPLRIRVTEMRSTRFTDFATSTQSMQVRLRLDWEWPVAPVAGLRVHVDNALHVDMPSPLGGSSSEVIVEMPALGPTGKLELSGRVTASFDGPYEDVTLPVPGTVELHGLAASARVGDDQGCLLTVEARDPKRATDAGVIGLSPVILAIGPSGDESLPHVHRVRTMGSGNASERWGLRVREDFGPIAELRLRISKPAWKTSFAFAFPPVGF